MLSNHQGLLTTPSIVLDGGSTLNHSSARAPQPTNPGIVRGRQAPGLHRGRHRAGCVGRKPSAKPEGNSLETSHGHKTVAVLPQRSGRAADLANGGLPSSTRQRWFSEVMHHEEHLAAHKATAGIRESPEARESFGIVPMVALSVKWVMEQCSLTDDCVGWGDFLPWRVWVWWPLGFGVRTRGACALWPEAGARAPHRPVPATGGGRRDRGVGISGMISSHPRRLTGVRRIGGDGVEVCRIRSCSTSDPLLARVRTIALSAFRCDREDLPRPGRRSAPEDVRRVRARSHSRRRRRRRGALAQSGICYPAPWHQPARRPGPTPDHAYRH